MNQRFNIIETRITADTLPARGSAIRSEQEGIADPSLNVLVHRMEQLEANERLHALETSALREASGEMKALIAKNVRAREIAEEGLRAAQEELQKLREESPMSPEDIQAQLRVLTEEAATNRRIKVEKFRKVVRDAPLVPITNATESPIHLQINGIKCNLPPGTHDVPEPFMLVWEAHLEAEQYARQRDSLIQGSLSFGDLEDWRVTGQPDMDLALAPLTAQTPVIWDEESGVV